MKAYIWKEEFQGHKIGEFALYGEDNFIDVWTNSDMGKMLKTDIPEELSLTPIHKLKAKYVANTTKMVPTTKVIPVLVPESTRIETQINELGEEVQVEVVVPEHYEDQTIVEEIEELIPEHFEIELNQEIIKNEAIQELKNQRDQVIADEMYAVFGTTNEASAQRQVTMYQDMLVNTQAYVGRIGLTSAEQVIQLATTKLDSYREYGIFVVEKIQEFQAAVAAL